MKPNIKKMIAAVILATLTITQTVSAAPLGSALASGQVSQLMYDNFDDNAIDTVHWAVQIRDSGPSLAEANQRLEMTVPANSSGDDFAAWFDSICQLRGDYDIQVDYELLTWPNANGVRVGLTDSNAVMHRVSSGIQPNDYPGGPDLYMTIFDTADHVVGITPTSDLSGKLRLQRVGSTINSYYFNSDAWVLNASNSGLTYAEDNYFALGAWSADSVFTDQDVKVAFDNLIINSGELVCPTPAAPDLAITQTADHTTVSVGDPIGFTIEVTNNGDATADIVTLSDTLPTAPELSWSVGGTDAAACILTAGALSCNFGDVLPGAVKTIRLTSPTQFMGGKGFCQSLSSTATVMAFNQPVNRSATATTEVLCPLVYAEVWSDTPGVTAGNPISFNAEFQNYGDGAAKDAVAEITLPTNPGLSWSIQSITPNEAADNCAFGADYSDTAELICSFVEMTPGQDVKVVLTSPTTSESCGLINSVGYLTISNGIWARSIMKPPAVTCPSGDITPPVITQTITGGLGANGWYTGDVSLTWSYSDPDSGVKSLTGCRDVTITQDQAATQYSCSATSDGGTSNDSVTIARDATKPVTAVTGVEEGAIYELGSVPQAGCATTDNLSGVATEATLALASGDTQGLGAITATCSGALDTAGNAANVAAVHFTVDNPSPVTFHFAGFFQPVDNWPVENTMKAGAGVPIRFSLGGDMGLNILAEGSPSSRQVACPSSSSITVDAIEQTTTSSSKLNYDAASSQYIYNWKTNKTWSGTCRVFAIQFVDGSTQQILFKFTK